MKASGAFFYENIWRNKIVSCPKIQTDGTGNYFTAHSKIMQKISAPQKKMVKPIFTYCVTLQIKP